MRKPTAPDEVPLHPETIIKSGKAAKARKPKPPRARKTGGLKPGEPSTSQIDLKDSIPVDPNPGPKTGEKAILNPSSGGSTD